MGSWEIPIFISFSYANQRTIPHINGNQQLLSFLGRNCSFSQNHGIGINIIVNRGEFFFHLQFHTSNQLIHHSFSIEHGKSLDYFHIMDIIFHQFSFTVSQIFGNIRLNLGLQSPYCFFNLLIFPSLFIILNQFLDIFFRISIKGLVCLLLIKVCHLQPQMAGTRMYHYI